MDFDFAEEEQAIADLTTQILGDKVDHERLRGMTERDEHLDHEVWTLLADAGIVGAALPTDHGGSGLGYLAVTAAIEQVGHHAALVPMLETVVMAGLPIAEFGSERQRGTYLPPIATGELIATAALVPGGAVTLAGGALSGSVALVPFGMEATLLLVPTDDGIHLVDLADSGVSRQPHQTTTGHPQAMISFEAVTADRLGTASTDEVLEWLGLRVDAAICSTLAGACEAALELTADYAKVRHQFDRAIAAFQAVSQRAGDAYIDTEAVHLTSRQAAWRVAAGRPAEEQMAIARWWASEAGFRVMHAATHLHGGVGVDRDYPLHRHFLLTRQLELTLGNSEEQLERLGQLIATR